MTTMAIEEEPAELGDVNNAGGGEEQEGDIDILIFSQNQNGCESPLKVTGALVFHLSNALVPALIPFSKID